MSYTKEEESLLAESNRMEKSEEIVEGIVGFFEDSTGAPYPDIEEQIQDHTEIDTEKLPYIVTRLMGENRIDKIDYNNEVRLKQGSFDPGAIIGSGELDSKRWDEKITVFYPTEKHENPYTEYNCQTYGWSPELHMKHSTRHNEQITECDLLGEVKTFSSSKPLKGTNSEAMENERIVRYEVLIDEDSSYVTPSLEIRKPTGEEWDVHPENAKAYLGKIHKSGDSIGKEVLGERSKRGEDLAELGCDLINEGEMSIEEVDEHLETYSTYFQNENISEFDFGNPITSNEFLEELDSYVETMKGRYEELAESKRQAKKDTKTAYTNYKGPVLDFIGFVENGIDRRLNS